MIQKFNYFKESVEDDNTKLKEDMVDYLMGLNDLYYSVENNNLFIYTKDEYINFTKSNLNMYEKVQIEQSKVIVNIKVKYFKGDAISLDDAFELYKNNFEAIEAIKEGLGRKGNSATFYERDRWSWIIYIK